MSATRYTLFLLPAILLLLMGPLSETATAQVVYLPVGSERGAEAENQRDGVYVDLTATRQVDPISEDWHESFADITMLPDDGWFLQNNSDPEGSTSWSQGNPDVFPSHEGDPNHFIAANWQNAQLGGTISNWLLTPHIVLQIGTEMTFWTRGPEKSAFPDRLIIRLSTEGESTDVGTGANDVGDFTEVVIDINPSYDLGGYPEEWTFFSAFIADMDDPGSGRFAFHYFIDDTNINANYIGIDAVSVTQPKVGTESGAAAGSISLSSVFPNPVTGSAQLNLEVSSAQHVTIEVFNLLGQRVATVFEGTAPVGRSFLPINGSEFTAGVYIVRVVGEDVSQSRKFVVSH